MKSETLENETTVSRSQFVYEKIRDRIIDGSLKPNASLTEEILAEEFKVSRTPIREALRMLERDNFIEIIPRKGAFIKSISLTDIQEIFTIREALEGISARLAATMLTNDEIEDLEKILDRAKEEYKRGEFEVSLNTGNELHNMIIKATNNFRISNILTNLKDNLNRLHHISAALPGGLEKANEEHFIILSALKERNEELSEKKMREHIIKTREHLVSQLFR